MKISLKAYLGFFAVMAVSFIMLSGHKVSAAAIGIFTDCSKMSDPSGTYTSIQGVIYNEADWGLNLTFEIGIATGPNIFWNYKHTLVRPPDFTRATNLYGISELRFDFLIRDYFLGPNAFYVLRGGVLSLDRSTTRPLEFNSAVYVVSPTSVYQGFFPAKCVSATASSDPLGGIDSCELDGATTVIKGWAWDPDITNPAVSAADIAAPRVQAAVVAIPDPTSYSRTISGIATDITPYRNAEIREFLEAPGRNYPNISSSHGFEARFANLAPEKTYGLQVFAENIGGGPPKALDYNLDVFTASHIIPANCKPVQKAKDTVANKPKQCINGVGCENVVFGKDPVVKKPITVPVFKLTGGAGDSSVGRLLSVLLGLAGGIALLVIVVAGFRFVTSQGNPDATTRSRNTIIYALIGLVICTLAYSIVTFVLERIV